MTKTFDISTGVLSNVINRIIKAGFGRRNFFSILKYKYEKISEPDIGSLTMLAGKYKRVMDVVKN